jgi:phenylacetate-CoA ligase
MAIFAAQVLEEGLSMPRLRVVITNAERVSAAQRQLIEEACRCEVRESYGMCEMVGAASECAAHRLHVWPEAGYWEVLADDSGEAVAAGDSGRLVATGLFNEDMPLIRYSVGDRVRLSGAVSCDCGRLLPLVSAIEGRLSDLIQCPDGRYVFWLNPVFQGLAVRESQILQLEIDRIRVLIVPAPGYGPETEETIIRRLKDRVGSDMVVEVRAVEDIPIGTNGKRQAVISFLGLSPSGGGSGGER